MSYRIHRRNRIIVMSTSTEKRKTAKRDKSKVWLRLRSLLPLESLSPSFRLDRATQLAGCARAALALP